MLLKRIDEIKESIKKNTWLENLQLVIGYGGTVFLLLGLLAKLLPALVLGDVPTPQSPPPGYFAEERQIHLYWSKGNHKGNCHVQVAEDGDFRKVVFSRETSKKDLLLPPLAPGKEYYWRVLDRDSAKTSCFRTSNVILPI